MAISYAENAPRTCPACGERFAAEVWMLVDAAERPDLVELLRDERLNLVRCPRCGHEAPAGAPLLLHDGAVRRVYFAAPADAAEHEVREQAQALLYVLVGSLPEDSRLPYLGDVQVEQELAGVRRALLRWERTAGKRTRGQAESAPRPALERSDAPTLLDAVRALVAADSAEDIEAAVAREPRLLSPEADTLLADLADAAYGHGEREVARALAELRQILRDMRGDELPGEPAAEPAAHMPARSGAHTLSDAAFAALMRARSLAELGDAVRDHPALLDPWADDELGARVEAALDDGDDRRASAVEERRDALAGLRAALMTDAAITRAVQDLIRAGDQEDALAQAISNHPALLTDAAHEALFRLAAESRARGDDALAERAVEYRAMLRKVREGLEEAP